MQDAGKESGALRLEIAEENVWRLQDAPTIAVDPATAGGFFID
jgi:hypothetical protein